MTAADLVRVIADHGVTLATSLKVDGAKAPPDNLLAELRARKSEVIAHLLGLDLGPCAIDDGEVAMFRMRNRPRGSWLIGLGILARRLVHTTDPDVRSRLEQLIRITPLTDADFAAHEERVNSELAALKAEGKLPPV